MTEAPAPDLILASASPRRRELLGRLGLNLRVMPVDLDETPAPGERAQDYVRRVAHDKCVEATRRLGEEAPAVPVLAADTTVILDGAILGKPDNPEQAAAMLRRLAGRRHEVTTAYTIQKGTHVVDRAVTTLVSFRLLEPREVDAYVASREWDGKAGGYAVQGIAAVFVTEVRGSITNVIGLPVAEVVADLRAVGGLPGWPPAAFGGAG